MAKKNWGFNVAELDPTIRPQDDFFQYVSSKWIAKNPIPKTESRWGSFTKLRRETDKQLIALVKRIAKAKSAKPGSPEQMVRDMYQSALNLKERKKRGLAPLLPALALIDRIKESKDIVPAIAKLEKAGHGGIWGAMVDQDMKNSERYVLHLGQGGLGLPDRDYYLKDDAESKRVREEYKKHLVRVIKATGISKTPEKDVETVYGIEYKLAVISMTKEDLRDVDKTYFKYSLSKLAALTPNIDWKLWLRTIGAHAKEVIVMQPEFFKAFNKLLTNIPVEDWKTYLRTHEANDMASALTPELEKLSFEFYGTVLRGTKHMKPLWRRALGATNGSLSNILGKLYVEVYFSREAKRKITSVVDDLMRAYEARLKNLDWMSASTKKKALQKLNMITRKLGYPDKWKSYNGLVIRADDYAGNLLRSGQFETRRALRRLIKPVDRKEWFMSPQTVNAYYSFGLNDIAFPAGILQPPFFDTRADDALNYGSMGMVIGHEITHGFDDQGSKFNGKGNRMSWWTKEDRARFDKKAKVLVKQFNEYKVADGVRVNGQLTLGENIADLGGFSIAYDAYQLRLQKTGRKIIDGLTPEQRFFVSSALFEREHSRPESEKTSTLTDPHSPAKFRVNGPASNLPEFYAAFGVKKGDKLYRPASARAKIW